jgi:hypothetical protein
MDSFKSTWVLVCLILFSVACRKEDTNADARKALARVGDTFLYEQEVRDLVPDKTNPKDSAEMVQRYVDSWVKKQLLLLEAENSEVLSSEEIQKRLEEYKFQLLVHAYKEKVVSQKLDTTFSQQEIEKYYRENLANFELKEPIIRCFFLKLSKELPKNQLDEAAVLLKSKKEADWERLQTYAYAFATQHLLEAQKWLPIAQITSQSPFSEEQILSRGGVLEAEDDAFKYWLKIWEVKRKKEIAPLGFMQNQIESILLNKRKVEIQQNLERQIYQQAEKKKTYEVFKR